MVLYDSMASDTPDTDMEVNFGNLSVIPEDVTDANGDGHVDVPDVASAGGIQVYAFDHDRIVFEFAVIDLDAEAGHEVRAFDVEGNLIFSDVMSNSFDGSIESVEVMTAGVRRLEIEYHDTAGVRGLDLDCGSTMPTPPPSAPPSDDPQASVADVDCNGSVGPTDALNIMKHSAGLTDAPSDCAAQTAHFAPGSGIPFGDLNCDERVDVHDALAILRWLAGMQPSQAVEVCVGA